GKGRYGKAINTGPVVMWLFHLHSALKIQPFSPAFPLAESKAFCWLSLWNFKKKTSTTFYGTA
ncbi:hypothetical protein, partial [Bilophila sp.]|uniref:hypothetical protein n=1 Tax=Bilophila sp. TaxID=1929485 RepID=UPI003077EAF1